MTLNDLHLVYFSPTGTTVKVMDAVAQGLKPGKLERHNLTHACEPQKLHFESGVALIGVPVYAGLVPAICLERLAGFSAQNIPTVLIALYGNRDFEDTLVELRDFVSPKGFTVIAAGAFIGEHSYSTADYPIAVDRPDEADLALAVEFGQRVAVKLASGDLNRPQISGNVPYKARVKFGGVAPQTDAKTCILCGKCAEVCPVKVITVNDSVVTEAKDCIMCAACVRVCPVGARPFEHPAVKERRELLVKNCSLPKTPTVFL